MQKKNLTVLIAAALLVQANGALAETRANQTHLIGSDTFNAMMDDMLIRLHASGAMNAGANSIAVYAGLGSSIGERQLEGAPSAGEPACTEGAGLGGADTTAYNSGCEEISPMSRPMDHSICNDEEAVANRGDTDGEQDAEGLAIARDGLVVIAKNTSYGQYGDACPASPLANTNNAPAVAGAPPVFTDLGVGNLNNSEPLPSGYVIGANLAAGEQWKDVLRVTYFGCKNDQGDCVGAGGAATPTYPRRTRCADPVREELLADWHNIVEGAACNADDGCPDGLKKALRRDDGSGTTQVFVELLGLTPNLTGRARITPAAGSDPCMGPRIVPIPESFAFCDGGQRENFLADCNPAAPVGSKIIPIGGDPIRKACTLATNQEGEDLCAYDGMAGVVQASISQGTNTYPTHQCTRGQFFRRAYIASSEPVCPDGTVPLAGACKLPAYVSGGANNFDCMNPYSSRPSTVAGSTDGRAYNIVQRDTAGTVANLGTALPVFPTWRLDMTRLDDSFAARFGRAFIASDNRCQESDGTRNISCAISRHDCWIGFAGREAAYTTANNYDDLHEPFQLQESQPSDSEISGFSYPFARELYVNAIGGFQNISVDCTARGDHADWCADQMAIADEWYGLGTAGNQAADIIQDAGFIPLPAAVCTGARPFTVGSTTGAPCGAPATQPLSACEPL